MLSPRCIALALDPLQRSTLRCVSVTYRYMCCVLPFARRRGMLRWRFSFCTAHNVRENIPLQ